MFKFRLIKTTRIREFDDDLQVVERVLDPPVVVASVIDDEYGDILWAWGADELIKMKGYHAIESLIDGEGPQRLTAEWIEQWWKVLSEDRLDKASHRAKMVVEYSITR